MPGTTLLLSPKIFGQLAYFIDNVDSEISGFGTVNFHRHYDVETNDTWFTITVDELFVPEQEVGATTSDMFTEGVGKLCTELLTTGQDEKYNRLHFWWHSHVNMPANFSTVDEETMAKLWPGDCLVSLVMNKKHEWRAKVMTKTPCLVMADVAIAIDWGVDNVEVLANEIATKLKKKVVNPTQAPGTAVEKFQGQTNGTKSGKNTTNDTTHKTTREEYLARKRKSQGEDEGTPLHKYTESEWLARQQELAEDDSEEAALALYEPMTAAEKEYYRKWMMGELDDDEDEAVL